MALTGRQYTITAGEHEATLVEVGAGLRRYAHRGTDVTFTYGDGDLPPRGCGAVLVPWPNRLRAGKYTFGGQDYQLPLSDPKTGSASHGLARWDRWAATKKEASAVTMALDIVPQNGYPFEVRVEVTYALDPEFGLVVTAVATNIGTLPAPFGAGFHPYIALRGRTLPETSVKVEATERFVVDEAQIPVATKAVAGTPYDLRKGPKLRSLRLDDAFTGLAVLNGRSAIDVRSSKGGARVWFDETFRYAQVFTPDIVARGQAGVAVEPMTCPADAFNSGTGLIVLPPGGTWSGSWGIQPL